MAVSLIPNAPDTASGPVTGPADDRPGGPRETSDKSAERMDKILAG
jgi:hypothetical protein